MDRPGLEPPPGNPKFPHLDGIRGLAALAIVGTHGLEPGVAPSAGPLWVHLAAALRMALPAFFLLSGFLLYRPYVAARLLRTPRAPARTFWWRRILRVVPAYWVATTLLAIWPGLPEVFGPQGWRYYAFVSVYSQRTIVGGIVPAWTICVDMSFYLLLPFFALGMDRLWRATGDRWGLRAELGVLALLFGGTIGYWLAVLHHGGLSVPAIQVREWNLVANLDWLAMGMAIAILSVRDRQHGASALTRLLNRPGAVALCWVLAAGLFAFFTAEFFALSQLQQHIVQGVACLLVFAPTVLAPTQGRIQQLLARREAMWLGLISYGIYLFHGPAINEIQRLNLTNGRGGLELYAVLVGLGLPVSLVLGTLSYRLVERPFLGHKRRASAPGPEEPAARVELA
jgi:peptidoglycan/LPS O-acetylase OafA/YrhL